MLNDNCLTRQLWKTLTWPLLCIAACATGPSGKPDGAPIAPPAPVEELTTQGSSRQGGPLLSTAVQIATNGAHFCARLRSGKVACWGDNRRGELGDGSLLPASTPVLVKGLEDAEELLGNAMCARSSSAGLVCWAGHSRCPTCMRVADSALWRVPSAQQASREVVSPNSVCFVETSGGLRCTAGASTAGMPSLRAVHQGHEFVCGEDLTAKLHCYWRHAAVPHVVFEPPLPAANEMAAGLFHICVTSEDRRVHCWGDRVRAGFAATTTDSTAYGEGVVVIDDLEARLLAAGYGHTCAATAQGTVRCWGRTSYRSTKLPQPGWWEIELSGVTQLAVGKHSACALLDTGGVQCWDLALESAVASNSHPHLAHGVIASTPVLYFSSVSPPNEPDGATAVQDLLRGADTPRRVGQIAEMQRGLVFRTVDADSWRPDRTACFVDELTEAEVPRRAGGRFSCDELLRRCVAQRTADATVFLFVDDSKLGRRLTAVIDYVGTAPLHGSPAALHEVRDNSDCALRRAIFQRDPGLIDDELTVLRNPNNDRSGSPGPVLTHHCGQQARDLAWMKLSAAGAAAPSFEDWHCDGLRCSYRLSHAARAVFVFRDGLGGNPKLWVVGDDLDGTAVDDSSSRPLLDEAIKHAKHQRCP